MHPNLVGPACFEDALDVGRGVEPGENPNVGDRRLAARDAPREAQAIARMPAMERRDRGRRNVAQRDRDVGPFDRVRLKLRLESFSRERRSGDHHHAARPLVEPMDDARPIVRPAEFDPVFVSEQSARQKTVDQGAARVTASGVTTKSSRLVQDDDVVVLVQDVEEDAALGQGLRRSDRLGTGTTRSPTRTLALAAHTTPSTVTPPCPIQRFSSVRDTPRACATNRSNRDPRASGGTSRAMVSFTRAST